MFTAPFEKNIECLENRFNQNGLEYYEALLQVLILAASKKNYDTELKKILGFYNNERSHDFDEDILKTQLQIFSKNFPLKEQLFIINIENYTGFSVTSYYLMLQQNFSKMGLIKTPICSTMSH